MKLSVVIPCLNEIHTIIEVIDDAIYYCQKYVPDQFEIIVADNGSTDGTLELLACRTDVRVVYIPVRGYGAALHWGILNSRGEYVIFGDADGSYPFLNLPKFLMTLNLNPDLVLGSRLGGSIEKGAMPFLNRYLGTPALTAMIRFYYNIPTTDCNSGMRLLRRSFYEKINMCNSGMEWASELLLKTALNGGRFIEVPIQFRKDRRNRPPHLSRWADGWRHLKTIIFLKPSIAYPLFVLFPALALVLYNVDFVWPFLFLMLTLSVGLGLAANSLLRDILDGKVSRLSSFLKEFVLVQYAAIFCLSLTCLVGFIPDVHLGTKLFIASFMNVIFIWTFFIETVKTQVGNRLPKVNSTDVEPITLRLAVKPREIVLDI